MEGGRERGREGGREGGRERGREVERGGGNGAHELSHCYTKLLVVHVIYMYMLYTWI